MVKTAGSLLRLLSGRERRNAVIVMILLMGMAVLELAGVASIMPFLTVAGKPEVVTESGYLRAVYQWGGFDSPRDFMMVLGFATLLVLVTSSIYRALAQYVMIRFTNMRRHTIGRRLLASHLRQPYEFFIQRNTSQLSTTILSEVDQLISHVLRPAMQLFAMSLVAVSIITLLVFMDIKIAAIVGGVLVSTYALIYTLLRRLLRKLRERASGKQ